MSIPFPTEIFELFIDELRYSDSASLADLKSASLVSHTWLHRCRTHLFMRINACYVDDGWYPRRFLVLEKGNGKGTETYSDPAEQQAARPCTFRELLSVLRIRNSIREISLDFLPSSLSISKGAHEDVSGKAFRNIATDILYPNLPKLCSLSISYGPRTSLSDRYSRYTVPLTLKSWGSEDITPLLQLLKTHPSLKLLGLECIRFDGVAPLRELLECMRTSTPRLTSVRLRRVGLREAASGSVWHLPMLMLPGSEAAVNSKAEAERSAEDNKETHAQHSVLSIPIRSLFLSTVHRDLANALFSSSSSPTLLPRGAGAFDLKQLQNLTIACGDLIGNPSFLEGHAHTLRHLTLLDLPSVNQDEMGFYQTITAFNFPNLTTLELHLVNIHDGTLRSALRYLGSSFGSFYSSGSGSSCGSVRVPLDLLLIRFKYAPRKAFIPAADQTLSEFARSVTTLRRIEVGAASPMGEGKERVEGRNFPKTTSTRAVEVVIEGRPVEYLV